MRKFLCFISASMLLCAVVHAQTFTIFRDIYPGTPSGYGGGLTELNGKLFFIGADPVHGAELWSSDGTGAGTSIVKDIVAGTGSSGIYDVMNVGGKLFFIADDQLHGAEIWTSDGTEAGTVMVKDINPGPATSMLIGVSGPLHIGQSNGILYVRAFDPATGFELWKSDGTEAGTVMVKDINPGTGASNAQEFVDVNGTLFFIAADPAFGHEVWKTDGSEAGTVMVKDINPGVAGSHTSTRGISWKGIFYFSANDGTHGNELWKSDGTEAGTVIVKDINPGSAHSSPRRFGAISEILCFGSNDGVNGSELWKSDGTETGTVMIKDGNPGPASSSIDRLVVAGNNVFFTGQDPINGSEFWTSDGTETGTFMLADINPGPGSSYVMPTWVGAANNTFYFTANNVSNGVELWKSNGTVSGTILVQDFVPGSASSNPSGVTMFNGKLFVNAYSPAFGSELWIETNIALPVNLSELKGQLSGNDGLLNWKTSTEQNTSHFEIERSIDGRNFVKTGTLNAAGNSSASRQYNYTDRNITSLGAAVVYYRLKTTDADGKFSYSKIIAINISIQEAIVMLYPNPVRESATLMIAAVKKENITYSIIDQGGRTLQQKSISVSEGSNMVTLETSSLATGVYTVVLKGTDINNSVKLIKN